MDKDSNQSLDGLFRLDWNIFTVPINGFLMPLIAIITLFANSLVLTVLLREQMRSPINVILASLAVSDSLTIACPVPCFVYFYTGGQRYRDWVPYSWCFSYFCLTDYLPTIFHTASIWLTASLAVLRYAQVCCPVESVVRRRLCTIRGAVCIVVGVFAVAAMSQVCRLGELSFSPVIMASLVQTTQDVSEDNETSVVEVTACRYSHAAFVDRHEVVYFNVYYWSRVLFIHIIPCSALVVLNAHLVRAMQAAHRSRNRMMSQPATTTSWAPRSRRATSSMPELPEPVCELQTLAPPSCVTAASTPVYVHSSGSDSSMRSTMMLVVVVGVFLLVEVPLSVLLLLVIIENTFDIDMFSDTTRYTAALFVNLLISVTYPLNLFVYCAMSERFRRTFCATFCRTPTPNNDPVQTQ